MFLFVVLFLGTARAHANVVEEFVTGIHGQQIVFGSDGYLYVAGRQDNRVYRIDPVTREITTIAGTGIQGHSGDGGPATEANLVSPVGIAVADDGSIYISSETSHTIRKIDSNGIIQTIGGSAGLRGYNSESLMRDTLFASPYGLTLDSTEENLLQIVAT
ncbi:MAG: hypothetical protein O3A77_03435 [bacterium]|nr:hypothetical protein [bacterium]